ncbi:hypothetical protein SCA6_012032 [Theobroma cacao]
MSTVNFKPPDSPESDHANQSNFEFPDDYFTFDSWLEDCPEAISSGTTENPVNQANEVNDSAGASSLLQGPAGESETIRERREFKERYAFRTKGFIILVNYD